MKMQRDEPVVVQAPQPAPVAPAPRAAPKPRIEVPIHDIEALLAIVSSIYHFDKGVRLHGSVYPQWKRVMDWKEKVI
jgi:hypothetical protein